MSCRALDSSVLSNSLSLKGSFRGEKNNNYTKSKTLICPCVLPLYK